MTLREYLADESIGDTVAKLAVRAGVGRRTVYRALAGEPVGDRVKVAISHATGNRVPVAALLVSSSVVTPAAA